MAVRCELDRDNRIDRLTLASPDVWERFFALAREYAELARVRRRSNEVVSRSSGTDAVSPDPASVVGETDRTPAAAMA